MPKPSPNRSFSSYSTLPTKKHTSVYKSLVALVSLLPNITNALPIQHLVSRGIIGATKHSDEPLTEGEFYIYMFTSIILVLLGGIFAGLTLGLMGQDEVYLKVLADSGTPSEQKCSKDVLKLIGRGKHWLLVTLLLSNVITNETLPVILDRFLGGGLVAVFSSTVSIVIFGEIIPQSVCVRYGLQLGAYFAPFVLCLMYVMYPVAYPISMLLDYILGQDHGTLYKKNGLKTLVTLHKTMGVERLNQDEVTIISSVLDLKAKAVCDIMTPIRKVYTMPSDKILNEDAVEEIFNAGFSRIPIHLPGEPTNFVGMLLVRILISYDPEDALPVSSFPLATLPETSLETSCLNILNYFQEGKSHMVVVSESPGMDTGAVGVLTLEDVIEELIGEEIIDESDVYVDLDKNIKRSIPGPLSKRNVTTYLHSLYASRSNTQLSQSPAGSISVPQQSYFHKRSSIDSTTSDATSNANARTKLLDQPIQAKQDPTMVPQATAVTTTAGHQINSTTANGMKPSNLAVDPLPNTNPNVKIKKQPQLSAFTEDRVSEVPRVKTPDYGSVHKTEAQAFVHGVHRNLELEQQQQQQSRSTSGRKLSVNHHGDSTTGNGSNSAKQFTLPSGKKKRNSVDLSDAKSSFVANNDGVPLPKAMTLSAITSNIDSNPTPFYRDNESSRSSRFTQTNLTSSRSDDSERLIGSPSSESILATNHSLKSSSGLIENIVNIRGVNKTVIEESSFNINTTVPGPLSVDRNCGVVESESDDDEREDQDLLRKNTSGSNSSNRPRRDSKRFWDWT